MRGWPCLILALPLLTGCPWITQGDHDDRVASLDDDTGVEITDEDGDGYSSTIDCDDASAAVYPGADETCNGIDDDCDDVVDEGDALDADTFYADTDEDGFGDAASTTMACDLPSGFSTDDSDCDDSDGMIFPGTDELCNGVDDDCDDEIDEADATDVASWYADADGDGYGIDSDEIVACDQPSGYAPASGDCDESSPDVNPGATELCDEVDNDCDGDTDEDDADDAEVWYADSDSDSYGDPDTNTPACEQPSGYVSDNTDCVDSDTSVNPSATEICDEVDNDCDGDTDEDDAADASTWFVDVDGDGYGDEATTTTACTQPTGYSADSTDCDDTNASANPGATEVCDSADNDCDGDTDESDAADATDWYTDADSDGYGDPTTLERNCLAGSGHVTDNTDCDDSDAAVYPGADEYCDGVDSDCDGDLDEDDAIDVLTWYADTDSDSYGDLGSTDLDCDQPTGSVSDSTDCDDADPAINPAADEICDLTDNNCDGATDEDEAVDVLTWYRDADGDSYGDDSTSDIDCTQPSAYVADGGDCDDTDSAINPDASETCDGADNDCDGSTDGPTASDATDWYDDADGDSYGDPSSSVHECSAGTGQVADSSDCDDGDAAVNPGAAEYCNGVDDDCDSDIDEDSAVDVLIWYADSDGDTHGDLTTSELDCSQPSGFVADSQDCDDSDAAVNPSATELCDGTDNDCDGLTDGATAADADTWYPDADADSYGDSASSDVACSQPSGYISTGGDCDDSDASINPAADEIGLNGIDEDCDGSDGDDMSLGDAHTVVDGDSTGDRLGWSISSAGDINGDSYDDIMIGAPNYDSGAGQVLVFYGPTDPGSFEMSEADVIITGDSNSALGSAIASVGDIDSDGYGDIILGASGQSSGAGMAYLIHGPITSDRAGDLKSMSVTGGTGHALGDFVGGGPDVDGDGYGDLFIGAPMQDYGYEEGGRFYVVPSSFTTAVTASSAADITARHRNLGAHLGKSACAGDYDGDGFIDLVVAGDKANVGGNYRGAAYLVEGPVDHDEYDFNNSDDYDGRIYGYSSSTYFGASMADVGDVDNDGYTDILVGAPKHDNGSSDTGAAFLFLGPWADGIATTTSAAQYYGSTGEEAGRSVTGLGDVDGDGKDDWSVGVTFDNPIGVDCGAAYILLNSYSGTYSSSSADGTLAGEAYDDLAGWSVANAGDTDGDGFPDLIVGAPQYDDDAGTSTGAGHAYLITGLTF